MRVVLIAVFGAGGALTRYGIGVAAGVQRFPWPTLVINLAGSLALGLVLGAGAGRLDEDLLRGVTVGYLGAFTTFSTFSFETQILLRDERYGAALLLVVVSVGVGVAGAAAGFTLGRRLAGV